MGDESLMGGAGPDDEPEFPSLLSLVERQTPAFCTNWSPCSSGTIRQDGYICVHYIMASLSRQHCIRVQKH